MGRRGSWKGPTLTLIAEKAGVSPSTVDRVLHKRSGVSRRNIDAVLNACAALGIGLGDSTLGMAASAPKSGILKIALVSECGVTLNARMKRAADKLVQRSPHLQISNHATTTTEFDPQSFTDLMRKVSVENDALLLICRDDQLVRRAISDISTSGKPVVCITTDLPNSGRVAYVGMDQVAAGSTAAYLLGRFAAGRSGRVVLVASAPYRCQEERESGFRRVLRAEFPQIHIQESISSNDDPVFSYQNMTSILKLSTPPLGVYNTAGGNPGIAKAIREFGLTRNVIFVGHEGNESSMRLLEQGEIDAVLTHDLDAELERATDIIRDVKENRDISLAAMERSRISVLLKYNTYFAG